MTTPFGIAAAESALVDRQVGVLAGRRRRRAARSRRPSRPRPSIALRVRIDQQLRGVEAPPVSRVVRAVDAVAVPLPGPDAGQVAVPVERRPLVDVDALLAAVLVEQAELDALGVLREEREVRAAAVPVGPERERPPGPHLAAASRAQLHRLRRRGRRRASPRRGGASAPAMRAGRRARAAARAAARSARA